MNFFLIKFGCSKINFIFGVDDKNYNRFGVVVYVEFGKLLFSFKIRF